MGGVTRLRLAVVELRLPSCSALDEGAVMCEGRRGGRPSMIYMGRSEEGGDRPIFLRISFDIAGGSRRPKL
ncbi:hypothetical protein BHM03_00026442 [Ensete ventricosum]|uniref:Uncharacterized protein n=1 Tax=Ensete ventricosum TaxID=4639 RepID=A0A426ZHV8_ENSVE|nr:hypothetical protein B296_00003723 [Ensete ventricosum]RZR73618.1 hypothetical protein BHM03_00026442 [Ensete ventricosum]